MDTESGEKAVPKRPIAGIDEALLETTENGIKGLLAEIHPRITYHLLDVKVDDRTCLVIAVEPGSDGPYETSAKAEGDKGIRLRAGRYNWPEVAFAELLTNAVLHKEYDRKQYVGVYVYRDTLSFINHNRPLPPVTIEDMNTQEEFRDRNYLSPEITRMFHALGLIESYGSRIRRAKHAMHDNGNPPLYFEPTNDTDDYTMDRAEKRGQR